MLPGRRTVCAGVALAAALQLALATGCSSSYPAVAGVGEAGFMHGARRVTSIDVLPIDVQLWTHRKNKRHPAQIAENFDNSTLGLVSGKLAGHGYAVNTVGWDGKYVTGSGVLGAAMSPDEIANTVHSLSSYGEARRRAGGALLSPHLPHILGERTGSDATLYVGGWAYAGKKGMSTGKKVAIGVLIVAVVAVVVVIAVAGGKGGNGGGLGGLARGAGSVAKGGLKVAGRVVGGATRVAGRVAKATVEGIARSNVNINIDCFGRPDTHYDHYSARPDYYRQKVPKKGRSQMLIEMTLVDNHTGAVLWHARQRFKASAEKHKQVARVMAEMLATLP